MNDKKMMGRPRIDDASETKRLTIRIPEREIEAIEKEKPAGQSISVWIRDAIRMRLKKNKAR